MCDNKFSTNVFSTAGLSHLHSVSAPPRNERIPEEYSHNDGAWVLAVGSEDGAVRMWDLGFEDDGEGDQVRCPAAASNRTTRLRNRWQSQLPFAFVYAHLSPINYRSQQQKCDNVR